LNSYMKYWLKKLDLKPECNISFLRKLTGIPQATISATENDRVHLGVERGKVLARALKCRPGVLAFPGWELPKEATA